MWNLDKYTDKERAYIIQAFYEEMKYWREEFHEAKRDNEKLLGVMREFLYYVLNFMLHAEVEKEYDYLKVIFERNKYVYEGDKKLYIEITTSKPKSSGYFILK